MLKFVFGAITGFFASGPFAGILLGIDILWSLRYFFQHGFKLCKPTKDSAVRWVDIGLTTVLLNAGLTSPSIAVLSIFAAWTVRIGLRMMLHKNDPTYWLNRWYARISNFISAAYTSACTFINDVKEEARS